MYQDRKKIVKSHHVSLNGESWKVVIIAGTCSDLGRQFYRFWFME